jgi:RNA polymerase sigma factor (sigma-70 family)
VTSEPEAPADDEDSAGARLRRRAQFDEAVARSRGDLLAFMRRRIRDVETASDLTQETLFRMLVYRDAPNIESHVRLMYRIAHNLVLEHRRQYARRHMADHVPLDAIEPPAADVPSVEELVDARHLLEVIFRRTFESLSPRCCLAFKLSRIDGLSYPEIARTMGITVKMVEKHISRALAACRADAGRHAG